MWSQKFILLKVFLLLSIFAVPLLMQGQNQIIFEELTINDGLSNGTINSIFKDSRGFMWFCTDDGLNRYDGYNFKIYRPERRNNRSVQSIQFLSVVEDVYGHIWIGTTYGLFYYSYNSDRIVKFSDIANIDFTNTPVSGSINCLLFDSNHYLWIGTYIGIARMKITSKDLTNIQRSDFDAFNADSNEDLSISDNNIFSFYEDRQHQIWVSTNSDRLDCYHYDTKQFTTTRLDVDNINNWGNLRKIIIGDDQDNLWISTQGRGLIYWNRGKNIFKQLNTLSKNNIDIDIHFIRSIMIDKQNRIWIGTDGNGLIVYDQVKNEIGHYFKHADDYSKISSNAIYSIFEDPSGIFWIGTYIMGLNKFVSDKLNFGAVYGSPYTKTGLSYNLVTGFCEDKNKQLWVSTDGGGLNLFNPKTNQFKHYKHDPDNPASISTNTTMTLFCDSENNIWVGSYNGGVNRFDQHTQIFSHYWHNPEDSTTISSNHPWSFAQDKNNNLWIATVDAGLNLLKSGSNKFSQYKNLNGSNSRPYQICSNAITQLFIDSNNNLWIGTEYGLDRVDLNQIDFNAPKPILQFKHYIPFENENSINYDRISYINEDKLGNIWVGTKGGGLNKLDIKTQLFENFSVNDGLPHNIIDGILVDQENNLWISTNNGISNLNTKTLKFTNYDISDGLQSSIFIKTSCFKTSNGMLLFGGINGFNAFNPEKITAQTTSLTTVLTDFYLFNQRVEAGSKFNDRIILPKIIGDLKKITLLYEENSFAFEFSALDYTNPEKISYSYKLTGFDKAWQITNSRMRVAKYTNLAPGEYTFSVKASTTKDKWSDLETSIVIIIRPPWWKTLWFKISAIILAIAFWVVGFSVRVYRLEKQKYILKSKVDEKTKQLQTANEQLRESNLMKDKFLSIIAHDLINPFNSILGFTDLLLTNYSVWDEKARLRSIKTINESSVNLFKLLNNLLQWSRSERGLLEYTPSKIDLADSISKSVELQSIAAKTKEISIDMNFPNGNFLVQSDNQLLDAIIRNLLSNAIKFTPVRGTVIIRSLSDGDNVIVSIIDNGVGISKDRLENLFRIDTEHSTLGTNNEVGTGLGLLLVKEFVSKQFGTLKIESEVGKGSNFSFTVPLWKE